MWERHTKYEIERAQSCRNTLNQKRLHVSKRRIGCVECIRLGNVTCSRWTNDGATSATNEIESKCEETQIIDEMMNQFCSGLVRPRSERSGCRMSTEDERLALCFGQRCTCETMAHPAQRWTVHDDVLVVRWLQKWPRDCTCWRCT